MSTEEKFENTKDKMGGQAKEGLGKLTGDKETETEGKADQAKAGAKEKLQDARDTVKGAAGSLLGDEDKDSTTPDR
ncbi:CsbD family protein [Brachybacterium sp. YJGR34]|uniref:CsbD family protein n=1 Tax=Brachybacterium sp. YJGR34 TaxID=2059911 RepID=UPI000E0B29A0|nr:CsbD family protein [Brachybacterium sp. YJGR34]